MTEQSQLSLRDIVAILRRRALLLAGVFGLIILSAAVAVSLLPRLYESSGTILVESQRIPAELIEGTANQVAEERIEIIKQRILTRASILRIADKHHLRDPDVHSSAEFVDGIRSRIRITLINADLNGSAPGRGALAFKLSFESPQPELAHMIARELVTLFLNENLKARTERASEATTFFSAEAERLKMELGRLEDRVTTYKQEHGSALPEHLGLQMNMVQRLENELKEIERQYRSKQEELPLLDLELAAAKRGIGLDPNLEEPATPFQELQVLRAELESMSGRYTDEHPDVREIKRRIDAFAELAGVTPEGPSAAPQSVPKSAAELLAVRIDARIASVQSQLTELARERQVLRERLYELESQILQGPKVERALATLMRDHANARAQYEEVRAKHMQAQMAANLEVEHKAERFILLEPPLLPEKPTKPDRKKILAKSLFFAIAGSGALVMLLEALNERVRGRKALMAVTREPPLVVIPYLVTDEEIARRRTTIRTAGIATVAVMLGTLVAAHFLYMPLDRLAVEMLAMM